MYNMAVHFELIGLEQLYTMAASADVTRAVMPGLGGADFIINIPVAEMRAAFRLETDGANITDVAADDVIFTCDGTTLTSMTSLGVAESRGGSAVDGTSGQTQQKDYVHQLALDLMSSHHNTDIFNNEDALLADLTAAGIVAADAVKVLITNNNASNNQDGGISAVLLEQLAEMAPIRLGVTGGADTLNATDAVQDFPFIAGDEVHFNYVITPNATNDAYFPGNSAPKPYNISLVLV